MKKRAHRKSYRAYSPAAAYRAESLERRTLLSSVSWISAYGGSWNTPSNWSTGAVPTPGSDVSINQPGFIQITLSGNVSIGSLFIQGDSLEISGGNLAIASTLNNAGTVSLDFGSQLAVAGAITLSPGATLSLGSGNSTLTAGSITSSGKFNIAAGDTASLSRNFTQLTNGTLSVQLGGAPASGAFGSLHVGATATLAGVFQANLVNSYSPSINDTFTPITYAAQSGVFASNQLPSSSSYAFLPSMNTGNLVITALSTAVPTTNINAGVVVNSVNTRTLGANLGWWDPLLTTPQTLQLVQSAGLNFFRFPGGASTDDYHFNVKGNYRTDEITIPQFAQFIQSTGGTGMVTIDYGSGSPQEAEAELAYLTGSPTDTTPIGSGIEWNDSTGQWQTVNWQSVGYWASLRAATPLAVDDGLNFLRIGHAAFTDIRSWEIGNELYGGWETDHHGTNLPDGTSTGASHDPATYAQFAAAFANFVAADQANLSTISIGIDSQDPTGAADNNWTQYVLSFGAKLGFIPGFISDHSYMQSPGSESDSNLLNNTTSNPASVLDWNTRYADYETLLTQTVGSRAPGVQVMATEFNSVTNNPGKQTTSLVNGLFIADALGGLLNSGFSAGMVWALRDNWITFGNNSGSLYGWRQGGDYGLLGDPDFSSPPATGGYIPYPSYFAEQLTSMIAQTGGQVVSTVSDNAQFSAYTVMEPNGHLRLLVINKSPNSAVNEQFTISGFTPASQATVWQYGQPQDTAQSQTSTGASSLANFTASLNLTAGGFTYSFPAYSMTVIDLASSANLPAPTVATPAGAPNGTVLGTTTPLSVLGADSLGESALIYTWSATSLPPSAPAPTFSINGTNAAKNTTATFYAPGIYTFTALIRIPGGPSVSSSANVTVNQTLSQITVSPPSPILAGSASEQFTAIAFDQFGLALAKQPPLTWSVNTGGVGGTINSTGFYTAPATGIGLDTIVATSGSVQGNSPINVAGSQPFNSIDFSNGFATAGNTMLLNGSGAIRGSKLVLTDETDNQTTSAYFAAPQNVKTFFTQFDFQLNNGWPMGNGFTFVIQNASPSALGQGSTGLGYGTFSSGGSGGIPNSIAIRFDLYNTSSGNGATGLYIDGEYPGNHGTELSGFNLRSWDPSRAAIGYNGTTLTVVLTDLITHATTTQTYTVNVPAIVGSNTAWVGFTGATSFVANAQSIANWTFTNSLGGVTPAAPTGISATAGNGLVALSWNPSAGASTYTVTQGTSASGPFTPIATGVTGTTFNATGLTNGQPYYFVVSAVNDAGPGPASAPVTATPIGGPVTTWIVDDGDAGFSKTGTWGSTIEPGKYYGNDHSFAKGGNGADVATYTFTGLTPGVYRVSATWRGDTNRETAAPFTIADGSTVVGNVTINQQLQPNSLTDQGFNWGDLGSFNITGTTLIVTLRDTASTSLYVDADAIRVQRIGNLLPPAAPTAVTPTSGNALVALSWNASLGATSYNVKYSTASGGPYTVIPNVTGTGTTINGLTNGTPYYFVVSTVNGVGEGANSAEVTATPTSVVPPVLRYIDVSGPGFSTIGTWGSTTEPGLYYGNSHDFAKGGNGADVATFTFTGLTPGIYRVSATWRGDTNRETAAPFTIADGSTIVGNVTINQQLQPSSLTDQGFNWGDLGSFSITGTTLIVTLRDTANNSLYVDADAIRIQRTGDIVAPTAPPAPTGLSPSAGNALVGLTWNSVAGATSYTIKYGTLSGGPYSTTVSGLTGTSTTILGLTNGTPYYFVISATNAIGEGPNSSPQVTATPTSAPPPPVIQIVDDGDAGFAKTGNWGSSIEPGKYYGNDHSFAKGGNGADFATYTFTGLTPGVYRVSATWRGDTNRETATPFTIADGGTVVGNVTVNQQLQPNSLTDAGSSWGDLGYFNITGTTMVVTIRDTANNSLYVDADAIRIERTGNLGSGPPVPNPVFYLDDRTSGWTSIGTWGSSVEAGRYYGNEHSYAINGNGADVSTWTFTGLAPGIYRVSATWRGDTNRATNAPFTIRDGSTALATVIVNQQLQPASLTDAGFAWGDLGGPYTVTSGTLSVSLSDLGTSLYVDADAIRIEKIG